MSAYWLTFKPLGCTAPAGWPIENLRDLVTRFEADPSGTTEWWRIAAHQSARVGDRVYLFKQGDDPRGLLLRKGPLERVVLPSAHICTSSPSNY